MNTLFFIAVGITLSIQILGSIVMLKPHVKIHKPQLHFWYIVSAILHSITFVKYNPWF